MKTVVIFGGSGFVGRHIIRRIAKNGYKIIVPHQNQINEAKLRLLANTGQIIPIRFKSLKDEVIVNIIKCADTILNLKTLWDEKKTTYNKGILDFNIELVNNIKKNEANTQLIYFSGLGVDQNIGSSRSISIHKSEKYIQEHLENSFIVRPGIIIGGGDLFLKGLLPLFANSFFIPLFGDGLSRMQPVFVDDVSLAIQNIIKKELKGNVILEFCGPNIFTYKELYTHIAQCLNKTRVLLPIPFNIVKLGVSILDKISLSPINSEQLNLFKKDNIASNKYKNLEYLGIQAQDLREKIKNIVIKNI